VGGLGGYLINNTVTEEISQLARERNNGIASEMESEITSFLQESKGVVDFLADQSVVKDADEAGIIKMLQSVSDNYDQFQSLYLGKNDGEMIIVPDQQPSSDFDPRDRPWFQNAENSDQAVWTDTYVDAGSGNLIISIIVLLVLIVVIVIYITRNVVRPIVHYGKQMQKVSEVDLDVELEIKRKDELGHLGHVFNQMIKDLKNLVQNIKDTSEQVTETSQHLEESSREDGSTSEQVAVSIQEVATGADEQAKNVEDVSINIQQLSEGIDKLEKTNEEVEELTENMNQVTEEGTEKMEDLSTQMKEIVRAMREVAAEIRELAEETSASAEEVAAASKEQTAVENLIMVVLWM